MVFRSRRRTSIGEMASKQNVGFKSKSRLNESGYLVARFDIMTSEGIVIRETGYSKLNVVSRFWKMMREDARLNASMKVLYREGYFVDAENYEQLDKDKIKSVKIVDFYYYYLENPFIKYSKVERSKNKYIVRRDKNGRFKKFYLANARKSSKEFRDQDDITSFSSNFR